MAIERLSQASILTLNKYSSMMAGSIASDFELISSVFLNTATASVTFSGLGASAAAYKNLQIRMTVRDTNTGTGTGGVWLQANGDSGANYSWHRVGGANSATFSNGSTSTTKILAGLCSKSADSAGVFGAVVTDILDWSSINKTKTIRSLAGNPSSISNASMEVNLNSGAWYSTSAITSLTISSDTNFATGSRFSLYGLRG